jgi:hypothetical protein
VAYIFLLDSAKLFFSSVFPFCLEFQRCIVIFGFLFEEISHIHQVFKWELLAPHLFENRVEAFLLMIESIRGMGINGASLTPRGFTGKAA